jgi:general secretion pathway protein H
VEKLTRLKLTQQTGFTLIEVIIVVLVIGIVISMAGLSFNQGGGERLLAEDSKGVAAKLKLLSEEATLTGRQYAIRIHQQGMEYWSYGEEGWLPLEGDRTYRPKQWRAIYRVALQVEGERAQIPQKDVMQPVPQVYFLSSGELTAFTLLLALDESVTSGAIPSWLIQGMPTGKIIVRKVTEQEAGYVVF